MMMNGAKWSTLEYTRVHWSTLEHTRVLTPWKYTKFSTPSFDFLGAPSSKTYRGIVSVSPIIQRRQWKWMARKDSYDKSVFALSLGYERHVTYEQAKLPSYSSRRHERRLSRPRNYASGPKGCVSMSTHAGRIYRK